MKKLYFLFSLLTFLLLTGCGSPTIGTPGANVEKQYFTGGQLRSEFIKSDKSGQNGLLKEYGYEGKVTSIVPIRKGVKHGVQTMYDSKGRVIRKVPYNNGKIHGIDTAFYPNGDKMITYIYINGLKEGEAFAYYPDGTVFKKAMYKRGKLIN